MGLSLFKRMSFVLMFLGSSQRLEAHLLTLSVKSRKNEFWRRIYSDFLNEIFSNNAFGKTHGIPKARGMCVFHEFHIGLITAVPDRPVVKKNETSLPLFSSAQTSLRLNASYPYASWTPRSLHLRRVIKRVKSRQHLPWMPPKQPQKINK